MPPFTRNTFDFPLHPAVARALDTARTALAAAGYDVREVEPPLLKEAAVTGARCLFGEAKALMDADVRKYGSCPHAGFGMGLERFVAWMGKLEHVRETIPYPRLLYKIYP